MGYPLKQNDTTAAVILGPAVDITDGVTPEIGITATTADDISVIKSLATQITSATAGTFEHILDGYYRLTLASTLIDTVGPLLVKVNQDATMLPVWLNCDVLDPDAYDALYATATTTGNLSFIDSSIANLATGIWVQPTTVSTATTTFGGLLDETVSSRAATTDLTSTATDAIIALIWDEVLTGATHNIASSSGRRLRQLEAGFIVAAGTAQAGAAGTITLATGESSSNDIFAGDRVIIVGGTGVGEHGLITTYNGTTKVATMSQNWVVTPDVTSEYELTPADVDVETWQHSVVTTASGLPQVDTPNTATQVWAQALTVSTATTTFGGVLDATVSSRSTLASTDLNDISASAVWNEPLSANATATTLYGGLVQLQLDAAVSSRSTLASTDLNDIAATAVWAALTSVSTATTTFGGILDATVSSRATSNASDVWAIVGTLATGGPPLAPTRAQQFDWLYTLSRDPLETTSTTKTVYGSATTVTLATAAVSDDGTTYTRGLFG